METSHARLPNRRAVVAGITAAVLTGDLTGLAHSQGTYPQKPVRVIIPFPAGGGGDTLARLMLTKVAGGLAQPFVFENVGGAGGNLGSAQVARADPDGYTLLYATNGTLAINQTLYSKRPFDPLKDLAPVSRLSEIPLVLVVRQESSFKSAADLLAQAKARPGQLTFGSAGNGTTSHLAVELLKAQLGMHMVHIPYRGGAASLTGLMGGDLDFMMEITASAMPHVKSGRLRALAVTTRERLPSLPDIPSLAESGVPGFHVTAWDALMARAGTPPSVIATLEKSVQGMLASPETVSQLAQRGAIGSPLTGDAFTRFIRAEIERWGKAVKLSGATVD